MHRLKAFIFVAALITLVGVAPAVLLLSSGSSSLYNSSGPPDATEGASAAAYASPSASEGGVRAGNTRSTLGVFDARFRQILLRDVIRPIYDPTFAPGDVKILDAEELVIGVEVNGESKAYPVGPLRSREMVNDVLGDVPILVTW